MTCQNPQCNNEATEKHHCLPKQMMPRSAHKIGRHKPLYLLLCKNCHREIHNNYTNSELKKKASTPILTIELMKWNKPQPQKPQP